MPKRFKSLKDNQDFLQNLKEIIQDNPEGATDDMIAECMLPNHPYYKQLTEGVNWTARGTHAHFGGIVADGGHACDRL